MRNYFTFFSVFSLMLSYSVTAALPLSTNSRWVVDENRERVKLACVNWVAHLQVMVAEGLSQQPVDLISKRIVSMGFNCVRLTWPTYLITNENSSSITVKQSFQNLGLLEPIAGVEANNPELIDLSLIHAFQALVSSLGHNNVMVILDNHITVPGWCCSKTDENGFFGDRYFDPRLWIEGLTRMATLFNGVSNVIGMSLRNELRGPRQNVDDWYKYMQRGAEAVHSANPDVLVILSGLNFDRDLSFLRTRPLDLTFTGKLVFEMHWYGFSDGDAWETGKPNKVCGRVVDNMMRLSGFVLKQGWPLFVSEFGADERGVNVNDNRYLNCFLGVAAELDLDWALWTLIGSYYLREGVVGMNEYYGILSGNSSFLNKISALQSPFQGTVVSEPTLHKVIYHPFTGLCIQKTSILEPLTLGPCTASEAWSYTTQNTLWVKGAYLCLQANDFDKPAKLASICSGSDSRWDMISDSKMHLASKTSNGLAVCLDIDSSNTVVTRPCKCLDDVCDPSSQWFKLVDSTKSVKFS